jgi:glycosyltransferase involved in cell wall biosynthesis
MDIALFHHFPMAGGAPRVLAEYVAHSPEHDFTLYTRQPERPGLIPLDERVRVRRFPPLEARDALGRLRLLWQLPRYGRELAAAIDAGGHDVVFCHPSFLVQAPEILPFLATPSVYYAPEPLRALNEPVPAFGRDDSLRARLVRSGFDPYEARRKALDARHIRAAPHIVTHSRFTAEELHSVYGVHSEVIPLGVNTATYTPGNGERDGFVLSVGALHPLKGHQFVIESLATLPTPRPRLVVVADRGELGPQLEQLARVRGVQLELRKGIPLPQLVELYRRAGVMACAQIREPFGLITLEAMAAGTPVVAVREGGLQETVVDGRSGLLVERRPDAFGAALHRVLADRPLADRLSAGGREEAERWTWDRTAAGFGEQLERAVAAHGGAAPAPRSARSTSR